jgi:flavin-binding protein dodecin
MATATVTKVIEVSSSSKKSIEDAVQGGLKKIAKSVKNIKGAWVNDIRWSPTTPVPSPSGA